MSHPYNEGVKAFKAGKDMIRNPYRFGDAKSWDAWNRGWKDAWYRKLRGCDE